MASFTEENYLKTIYHLADENGGLSVSTNALSEATQTKAASVTDMLKRLAEKKLIDYVKYQGVSLTEIGKNLALETIRKHRLWEVFLVDKLGFKWDEIHEIAEELEHIASPELINRLNIFLEKPQFDPHGDPIPDSNGVFPIQETIKLAEGKLNISYRLLNVSEDSSSFLQHLDKLNIKLGSFIQILNHNTYDNSMEVLVNQSQKTFLSAEVSRHLLVNRR
jgi:DtxR family transcriptional regulator, Mn-dependent transcriptional regulator